MSNLAVVLVDMDYPHLASYADPEIRNQIKVLTASQEHHQVVIEYPPDLINGPSSGPETLDSLKSALSKKAVLIWKNNHDGFTGTEFHGIIPSQRNGFTNISLGYYLAIIGASDLIVMGHHRDNCAYQTAKTGVKLGFKVHTSMDVLVGPPRVILDGEIKEFYTKNPRVKLYSSADDLINGVLI